MYAPSRKIVCARRRQTEYSNRWKSSASKFLPGVSGGRCHDSRRKVQRCGPGSLAPRPLPKLQRMPPESEFSRKILLVIGGASGIGRKTALLLAQRGAHIVIADADSLGAKNAAEEAGGIAAPEFVAHTAVDLGSPESLAEAIKFTVFKFGGIDGIVNTAAVYPVPEADGQLTPAQWTRTFSVNVTGNYLLARESEWVFKDQNLPATLVLTGSANAVVPKKESEAYDTSKAALNHLIRELAIRLGPHVRVNGIAPATVVAGSTMFPRDRVIQSLQKYGMGFSEVEST